MQKQTNTVWSDFIQNVNTLYLSRALRFADEHKEKYIGAFGIDNKKRILEIGCGPGALTQSLARWYPNAEVIGTDLDSNLIEFAKRQSPNIEYVAADATALPFEDNSFDVVISNTVQEHIEPSKFFKEQYRILKRGGICLVLSARKGVNIQADCISKESEYEKNLWAKVEKHYLNTIDKYNVGKYAMSESELPKTMEIYGFSSVSTEYITVNLTPDNAKITKQTAYAIINSHKQSTIDAINAWHNIAPEIVGDQELCKMQSIIEQKYNKRLELYDAGKKQWDTNVALTMILRGIK